MIWHENVFSNLLFHSYLTLQWILEKQHFEGSDAQPNYLYLALSGFAKMASGMYKEIFITETDCFPLV